MPLIGLTLGSSLARVIGDVADYLAAAAVIGVGAWMLTHGDGDDEQAAGRILATHGTAIVALGVSISLDELAIGFSLGLARLPLVPVIIAIGVQALIAAQLGLSLGARISEQLRERAEQVAAWPLGSGRCSPAELLRRRQPPPGLSHRLHGTAQLDLLLQQPVPRRPVLG